MSNLTRPQLLELHQQLTEKAAGLMKAKNQDYAHEGDVFRNFRLFGGLGILVRLSDKLARLRSFEENNTFAVEDEKLIDTIADTINYAVLYYAYKQEGKETTPYLGCRIDHEGNTRPLRREIVKDGPYCGKCEQLAEFRYDFQFQDSPPVYVCSNCRAESGVPLKYFTVMETL